MDNEIINPINLLTDGIKKEAVGSFLNREVIEIRPGYARVKMKMQPEYENFHGVTFGGIIMALADFAFGYAVNASEFPSVGLQMNFEFLTRTETGDDLTAECTLIKNGRRAGFSDILITNQKGEIVMKASGITIPLRSA